eukprot:1680804-Pyramimonas_sp.AAC.1
MAFALGSAGLGEAPAFLADGDSGRSPSAPLFAGKAGWRAVGDSSNSPPASTALLFVSAGIATITPRSLADLSANFV